MIILPWQQVPEDTLQRMLEDIVSRDGTDYGHEELSVEAKLARALSAIKAGRAVLVWDEETESANLMNKTDLKIPTGESP